MSYIRLEKDADGIVELIFDQQGKAVNVMGDEYAEAMPRALDELEAQKDEITGVYIRSGKPGQFFAGGDITQMLEMDLNPDASERQRMLDGIVEAKAPLRRLEALGVPIAVGINGAALGGGYEIALACHHRIALDDKRVQVGLPEAMLGLMPGAGGVVRMVRMLGMQEALTLISQGKRCTRPRPWKRVWCTNWPSMKRIWRPKPRPGSRPTRGAAALGASRLQHSRRWPRGSRHPGPDLFRSGQCDGADQGQYARPAGHYGRRYRFGAGGLRYGPPLEARYFQRLLLDQVARNMMTTFFVQMNQMDAGASRPDWLRENRGEKAGHSRRRGNGRGYRLQRRQGGY